MHMLMFIHREDVKAILTDQGIYNIKKLRDVLQEREVASFKKF